MMWNEPVFLLCEKRPRAISSDLHAIHRQLNASLVPALGEAQLFHSGQAKQKWSADANNRKISMQKQAWQIFHILLTT